MNCPNCGKKIDASAIECPNCGTNLTLTPLSSRSVLIIFVRRHFKWSERLESTIVGVILGIVSLSLPWDSAFVYSDELDGVILAQLTMNFLDLIMANQPAILFGASLFIAGMLFSVLNRWFVIVQWIGMIGLSLTMYSYVSSKLSSMTNPPDNIVSVTEFGIGYILAWLSILILTAVLIGEKGKEKSGKGGKQPSASETVERDLGGLFGGYIGRRR